MNFGTRITFYATALVLAAAVVACGGGEKLTFECDNHDHCLSEEACLGGICVDAPAENDPCPDEYEGELYRDLRCQDGSWQVFVEVVPHEIALSPPLPEEIIAGQSFQVAFQLLDEEQQPAQLEAVNITVALNHGQFSPGLSQVTESTDEAGVATFELTIAEPGTDYRLLVTSDHEALLDTTLETDSFDVLAAPLNGLAFITQPPAEETAGQPFQVKVMLIDDDERRIERNNVSVTLELNDGQFASGSNQATELTDLLGEAHFELTVEQAGSDYFLVATSDDEDFHGATDQSGSFRILAADPHPDTSWITGEDGVDDGEEEAQITIGLFDEFGNPIVGQTPDFTATGDGNAYGACTETDEEGIATCFMTSTETGEKTLSITAPVAVEGDTIEFLLACNAGAAPFGGGAGTADDPFRICSSHHLNIIGVGTIYLSDSFVVAAPIDLGGITQFNIIGQAADNNDEVNRFKGIFDGGGHPIENLTIIDSSRSRFGLFGEIDEGALVKNVALENVDLHGDRIIGGLAGMNRGTIENSYTTGKIIGDRQGVGGLVGATGYEATIINSYSTADVEGVGDDIGGLIGYLSGHLEDSYFDGTVSGTGERVGGLAGMIDGTVLRSFSTGEVEGAKQVGGLTGYSEGHIINSYSTAAVTGDENIGGLVSYGDGSITNSYAAGPVEGNTNVGGLGGGWLWEESIESSYWDVNTCGTSDSNGGEPLYTNEFDDENNFEGWDFVDVWTIGEAPDGVQRPILQWQLDD